jgi:hypothetical protein
MSVFNVFKGGGFNPDTQFAGTATAGKIFANVFTNTVKKKNVFRNLIVRLIRQENCIVTYNDVLPDDGNNYEVKVDDDAKGKKRLYYEKVQGQKIIIDIEAVQDDPGDDEVKMVVPARPVQHTDPYLTAAIQKIKNTADNTENQAFLLGMLLLKRCR